MKSRSRCEVTWSPLMTRRRIMRTDSSDNDRPDDVGKKGSDIARQPETALVRGIASLKSSPKSRSKVRDVDLDAADRGDVEAIGLAVAAFRLKFVEDEL